VEYPPDNLRRKVPYERLKRLNKGGQEEGDELINLISNGSAVKALSWEHERDFRLFLYLHFGVSMEGRSYFREFGPTLLKRVVLSVRSQLPEFDVKAAMGKWMRPYKPHVEVVKAKGGSRVVQDKRLKIGQHGMVRIVRIEV